MTFGNPFPRWDRFQVVDERTGKTLTAREHLSDAQNYICEEGDVANLTVHDSETADVWWFDDYKWRHDS